MFDQIFTWARVLSSSVDAATKAVRYSLAGIGSDDPDAAETDDQGEGATDQTVMTGLGLIGRPREPETGDDGLERILESIGIRVSDGVVPIGFRDRRLHERFPAPKAGTIALVGYGGAFLAFDDTDANSGDELATLATLYVPYSYSSGVAAKAHALIFDPLEESVSLIQGDGSSVLLTPDYAMLRSPDGSAFVQVENGRIVLSAAKVVARGGLLVGDESVTPPKPVAVFVGGVPSASALITTST